MAETARILVVDDDEGILKLVVMWLQNAGYRVQGVSSGREALDLVDEKGVPDMAVLDVRMPGMDGFELLKQLRTRDDNLPIVFLSANVLSEQIEEGKSLGARYLTKPFVASALLRAVEQALARDETW